ncbi:hypothetical protein J2Z35_001233 [Acetoanaerobium pronyense]|uniref:Uncharacterized protein n=1 Tax=Acetoanaerobium pronyense TaxID=1482736 RepID=A0ABS4KLF7_9FIRM|nr:hypothetical protein [Acetoanaerobium pronyense]MBP2027439.1 hypothetical protein [Acetoanaerobium pronyense]
MKNNDYLIENCIEKIKHSKFGDLIENIGYDFDSELDIYFIWHDSGFLERNEEFKSFIGKLLYDIFYINDIFNISVNYDYEKASIVKAISYDIQKEESIERGITIKNYSKGNIDSLYIHSCYEWRGLVA